MVHDDGELYWHDPAKRAVFDLNTLAPNARLQRYFRNSGYRCTVNKAFEKVMRACAERETTWINDEMVQAYGALHKAGHAISVETWDGRKLVGGIYGVHIGHAFFGESMFSRATNASKMAFHHLCDHLRTLNVQLFDSQYINDHTRSLGASEVSRKKFKTMLHEALLQPTRS
jgi:leucyl/phenylalanyl-tRNA---protein transferase